VFFVSKVCGGSPTTRLLEALLATRFKAPFTAFLSEMGTASPNSMTFDKVFRMRAAVLLSNVRFAKPFTVATIASVQLLMAALVS
jgi:hypothetical protein